VGKKEFVVSGGLAEELTQLLESNCDSVDDWIMQTRPEQFEGKECSICFCPIDQDNVGRHMRCGCWLHFECLGHALQVKIKERTVGDEDMSTCPAACGNTLGRPIPPGVVCRAVGNELFSKYLDIRLEVEWENEMKGSGTLVAECPSCRFLVVCNEEEDMFSVKCLRQSCAVDRFCAHCCHSPHRPLTCEEHKRKLEMERDVVPRVRAKIEDALLEALFRKCIGCGVPVERMNACCHMTCTCKAQFSWVCGQEYSKCKKEHPCVKTSIYLHKMPKLTSMLQERGLSASDNNASDIFLELRCLYLLSFVRREVGEEAWSETRRMCPEALENVIRSNWNVKWEEVGDFDRLHSLMPVAFPKPEPA